MNAPTDDQEIERRRIPPGHLEKWNIGINAVVMGMAFLVQTGVGIYFYATQNAQMATKIDYLVERVRVYEMDRYTKDDGRKDQELSQTHYEDLSRRLHTLEDRMNGMPKRSY